MTHAETFCEFHLNYGLIGNGQISALISESGSLDWLCLPRLDAPSVFARILDAAQGGHFAIESEAPARIRQYYRPNTNVLETVFEADDYAFKVIDFIPRYSAQDHLHRPIEVHRQIVPLRGTPSVRLDFEPRFNYAQEVPRMGRHERSIRAEGRSERLFLHSSLSLEGILAKGTHLLQKTAYCVLTYDFPLERDVKAYSQQLLQATVAYWQTWVRHCAIPPQYQQAVIRSALALKLHLFEDTGATIAATTTSIPEIHGSERCWDYRFCWIRDSFFLIDALSGLAHFEEMEKFILYLKNISRHGIDKLQPLYSILGEARLDEIQLTHLRGAADSGMVRVGNAAYTHQQFDIYGEMILSLYPLFFDLRLNPNQSDLSEEWQLIQELVAAAWAVVDQTDSGIWEFRDIFRHYTFSKLMIWVALDRGAKIAEVMDEPDTAMLWRTRASQLRAQILDKAWSEADQMFAMSYGGRDADAAVLLMPVMGLIDPHDPRFVATVKAYRQRLMKNGHVFRYVAVDDFGEPECAFNFCTFWMIHALYLIGEEAEARSLFENMLRSGNHLGLFSEDTHPESGKMYGNFPQTYTHVGIIQTARLLSGNRSTYALDYC
ncbi:MAG: glycoside hydrolase family 15 protein [Candidatus Sericytochromatia bacterium]|nr:glycoside hydrolase family 15 protein [Candidatus Sericytochromatia bacterium]